MGRPTTGANRHFTGLWLAPSPTLGQHEPMHWRVWSGLLLATLWHGPSLAAPDDTSEGGDIVMPEDGGPLPRAAPPEAAPPKQPEKNRLLDPSDFRIETPTHEIEGPLPFRFDGYLRILAEAIQDDDQSPFVGQNDGFKMASARIGFLAGDADLHAYVSLETAAGAREGFNDANQEFRVAPRDAFLSFRLNPAALIRLGRFKTPYDIGSLEPTRQRVFIDAPVETRGVRATQGFEVDGLRQGRQVGAMLHSRDLGITGDGLKLGYALGLFNGRSPNLVLNDNDRPAGFLRLNWRLADVLELNTAGFVDQRTVGELPNLFREDVWGVELSTVLRVAALRFEGQLLLQRVRFVTSGQDSISPKGYHAQVSFDQGPMRFAYRFAGYDPVTESQVAEHTAGIAYFSEAKGLLFALNGTLALEPQGIHLSNNRVTFLTQYVY